MKIVSKCGQVQIDLNLLNTEVKMQVEKMPKWLRGEYCVDGYPMHKHDRFGLYSGAWPSLSSYNVWLWGTDSGRDTVVARIEWDNVAKAANYCQHVIDLIESFDSTKLTRKRAEPITSKCGKVKVQLDLDGSTVSMQVLAMPEELRGNHGHANPMHAAHGLVLRSNIDPTLYGNSVYLRGTMRECDDNVAKRLYVSPADAIDYYTRVKALIEGFDSTGLLKKDEKKEWRIARVYDSYIGRNVFNLYRFEGDRRVEAAHGMHPRDAHALAAALGIEHPMED